MNRGFNRLVSHIWPTRSQAQVAAALRIRRELAKADEGNYGENGWYSYLARKDLETVVEAVLGS